MNVQRASAASSVIDILDRVLDKGIVIDAWVRVCLVGIDLLTIEARVTVASFETWLRYGAAFAHPIPMTTTIKSIPAQGVQLQLDDRVPAGPSIRAGEPRSRPRR